MPDYGLPDYGLPDYGRRKNFSQSSRPVCFWDKHLVFFKVGRRRNIIFFYPPIYTSCFPNTKNLDKFVFIRWDFFKKHHVSKCFKDIRFQLIFMTLLSKSTAFGKSMCIFSVKR